MINTRKLLDAKIDTTKNDTLKVVYALVGLYNGGSLPSDLEKINVLERILLGAGDWLTSHRPKGTATNLARWSALDDLASQAILEGNKLGAKFLSGPTNWKDVEKVGVFHHSTFLSGSAVMAAGELVVQQGLVKCITAKSGHYTPSVDNMRTFVRNFPEIPGQAVIIPDFASNPLPAFRVSEFRFGGSTPKGLKRADVQTTLPAWAQAGVATMLSKITA
jgi:hypothetical protein